MAPPSSAFPLRAIARRRLAREKSSLMNRVSESALDTRRIEHYRRIVARFEAIARASLEGSVRVSDLSRAVGVTSRTLERAVHAVHATTPLEFLRALRLSEARFGFRELVRFAGEYRDRFVVSQSETVRRSARDGCEA